MAEFTIVRPGVNCEIDIAASSVGHTLIDQLGHQFDNGADHAGGTRIVVGRAHIEADHIGNKVPRPAVTQGAPIFTDFLGFAQNIVINIGYILDVVDRVALPLQIAEQNIHCTIGEGMTEMGGVVGGDPTDVESDRLLAHGKGRNVLRLCVI